MSRCYNFGPTFRADSSSDRTHLAEFYMVEAEVAFPHSLEDILLIMMKTKVLLPPVSSTKKMDRHDITEIWLKVAFNTITLTLKKPSDHN
jgi:aspartyl/asparaginyl-tRNA synthetase